MNPIKSALFFDYAALSFNSLLAGEICILSLRGIANRNNRLADRSVTANWHRDLRCPNRRPPWKTNVSRLLQFQTNHREQRKLGETFRNKASLDNENWNAYIAFLKNDISPKSVTSQHDRRVTRPSPIDLDKSYMQVEYEYTLSDGTFGKNREIFAFIKGDLFLFSFKGPKVKVDGFKNWHNLTISRMNFFE